jgi:hypothetical protein
MRWLTYPLFAYAVVNFILFAAAARPNGGGPNPPPAVFRVFSGHWMAFYAAAAAVQFSALVVGRADAVSSEGPQRRASVPPNEVSRRSGHCDGRMSQ